jgi:hypothetical protein
MQIYVYFHNRVSLSESISESLSESLSLCLYNQYCVLVIIQILSVSAKKKNRRGTRMTFAERLYLENNPTIE